MKFQLAHFTVIHGKPFKLYSDMANFEKDVHNVDLGNGYLILHAVKPYIF